MCEGHDFDSLAIPDRLLLRLRVDDEDAEEDESKMPPPPAELEFRLFPRVDWSSLEAKESFAAVEVDEDGKDSLLELACAGEPSLIRRLFRTASSCSAIFCLLLWDLASSHCCFASCLSSSFTSASSRSWGKLSLLRSAASLSSLA